MTTTYLLYARSGHEFDAEAELRDAGISVWCGRAIEWKRVGKKRKPEPVEKPALPNYLFAIVLPHQFTTAQSVRWVAPKFEALSLLDERALDRFAGEVDRAYEDADKIRRANEVPVSEFRPGERLEVVAGVLADKMGKFRRVVEQAHDLHPRLELEIEGLRMHVDPLDVRRA